MLSFEQKAKITVRGRTNGSTERRSERVAAESMDEAALPYPGVANKDDLEDALYLGCWDCLRLCIHHRKGKYYFDSFAVCQYITRKTNIILIALLCASAIQERQV